MIHKKQLQQGAEPIAQQEDKLTFYLTFYLVASTIMIAANIGYMLYSYFS